MKKLLYLFAAIVFTTSASAQLQNLDFENWEDPIALNGSPFNNPVGWQNVNRWFGTEHATFGLTFQDPVDTLAQKNDYALKLSVWYSNTKDAAYQTAPINYKPFALKGYYKYEENYFVDGTVSVIDTAQVVVILTKWNIALQKNDTIGLGVFKTATPTATYTEFNANIQYFSSDMPEKITILLDPSIIGRYYDRNYFSSESDKCSWFTVDNLSLISGSMSVHNPDTEQNLTVYPNPTSDKINFEAISGTAIVLDVSGKRVMNLELNNTQSINIQHLKQGTYFLQIKNKNNRVLYSKFIKK